MENDSSDNPSMQRFLLLEQIKRRPLILKKADDALRDDKDFILSAIGLRHECVKYASQRLRKDVEVALKAVSKNGRALKNLDSTMRDHPGVVLAALKKLPSIINLASERLKDDESFMYEAITIEPVCLHAASARLKDNKPLVLKAVGACGGALENASPRLKADREVVGKAVNNDGMALVHAHESFKTDKDLTLQALNSNMEIFPYIHEQFKADKSIALKAMSERAEFFPILPPTLQKDQDIVAQALEREGMLLDMMDEAVKRDKQMVKLAVSNTPSAIEHASASLQSDHEFIFELLMAEHSGKPRDFHSEMIFYVDRETESLYNDYSAYNQLQSLMNRFLVYSTDPEKALSFIEQYLALNKSGKGSHSTTVIEGLVYNPSDAWFDQVFESVMSKIPIIFRAPGRDIEIILSFLPNIDVPGGTMPLNMRSWKKVFDHYFEPALQARLRKVSKAHKSYITKYQLGFIVDTLHNEWGCEEPLVQEMFAHVLPYYEEVQSNRQVTSNLCLSLIDLLFHKAFLNIPIENILPDRISHMSELLTQASKEIAPGELLEILKKMQLDMQLWPEINHYLLLQAQLGQNDGKTKRSKL